LVRAIDEKQRRANEAVEWHLDLSAVALDSLGTVLEWNKVCKITQEGVLGVRHVLEVRRSRDY